MSNLNNIANKLNNKYFIKTANSEYNIFKDCDTISSIIELIIFGLNEYKDYIYENADGMDPEIIKAYDEGLALIRNQLHAISGQAREIDDKIYKSYDLTNPE